MAGASIALAADAKVGFTGKNAADLDFFTEAGDDISHIFRNVVIDVIRTWPSLSSISSARVRPRGGRGGIQDRALVLAGRNGFNRDTVNFVVGDAQFP